MYVYDDDNNVNRVIWKPRNRYPKAEKTFQKWKSTHSSIWQQNQPKYPKSLYISYVVSLLCYTYFKALRAFWFLEKAALCKLRVIGTVPMFQLTRNSPTNAYIS